MASDLVTTRGEENTGVARRHRSHHRTTQEEAHAIGQSFGAKTRRQMTPAMKAMPHGHPPWIQAEPVYYQSARPLSSWSCGCKDEGRSGGA
jgi:hypothetical protein